MRVLLLVIALCFSAIVQAETAICTGEVKRIAYHAPNGFYLAVGESKLFRVCSMQTVSPLMSADSCKLIATLATTARATGKQLQIYVDNAPSTSCADITEWFLADVRFVELYD